MSDRENISLRFSKNLISSVRAPNGLADSIDEVLALIDKEKGVKFSRNSFILKAIRFYLDHLLTSKDMHDLLMRIHKVETE